MKRLILLSLVLTYMLFAFACQTKQEDIFILPKIPKGYVVNKNLYLAEGDGIYVFIENNQFDYETIGAEICKGNAQLIQDQFKERGNPKENLEEYVAIQNILGITEVYLGNYDRAYIYFNNTIDLIKRKNLSDKNKILTVLYNNAGAVTVYLTKIATNDKRLKKAAELSMEPYMGLVIAANQLGRIKTYATEKEYGIMIYRAQEIIKKEAQIKNSPGFVLLLAARYVSVGYILTGQEQKAIEVLDNYIPKISASPEYNLLKAHFLSNKGYCKDLLGDYENAIIDFQNSIALADKTVNDNSRQLAGIYSRLGVSYMNCEDWEAGLLYTEKALPGYKYATPSEKGILYWNAGIVSYQLEEYEQTRDYLLRSYINNQMIIEQMGAGAGQEFGKNARQVLNLIYNSENNNIADFDKWLKKESEKYRAEEYSYHRYPDKLS